MKPDPELSELYENFIFDKGRRILNMVKILKDNIQKNGSIQTIIQKAPQEFAVILIVLSAIHNGYQLQRFYDKNPEISQQHAQWTTDKIRQYSDKFEEYIQENPEILDFAAKFAKKPIK